jgi:hypothetical protein
METHDLFEPVLSISDLAERLHVSVQTLYDLRSRGRGPRGSGSVVNFGFD